MNLQELDSYNLSDAVKFNDTLNPAIWTGTKMRPEVREALLAIARDFEEFLGITDLELKDITVSGSNAGYTYTPHSDIDLHLVVDLPKADASDVYRELFDAKKYAYNDMHNITIGGYDVELYVENANTPPVSKGMFSLLKNDWISIPKKRRATVDDDAVRSRYDLMSHAIAQAIASKDLAKITALTDKIKKMRQAGLAEHGELGPENLAYKILRNQGDIEKLYSARAAAKDAELSLSERAKPRAKVKYGYSFNADTPTTETVEEMLGMQTLTEKPESSTEETIHDFVAFCTKKLNLDKEPNIKFKRDPQWSKVHKTFGRYMHDKNLLEVSLANRHVMDILRTIAHELTHQRQHEVAFVPDGAGETGSRWENEANAKAGVLMRDYGRSHPELFDNEPIVTEGDTFDANPEAKEFGIMGHKVLLKDGYFYVYKNGELIYRSPTPRSYTKDTFFRTVEKAINQINNPDKTYFKSKPGQGVDDAYKKLLQVITHRLNRDLDISPATIKNDVAITAKDFGVTEKELRKKWAGVKPYRYSKYPELFAAYTKFSNYFSHNSSGPGPLTKIRMSGGRDQWLRDKMSEYMQQHNINLKENASGYIPKNKKEARDPRFSMALTQDIKPGQVGKEANKLGLQTDSQGHPKLLAKTVNVIKEEYSIDDFAINVFESFNEYRRWVQSPKDTHRGMTRYHANRYSSLFVNPKLVESNDVFAQRKQEAKQFSQQFTALDQREDVKIAVGKNISLLSSTVVPGDESHDSRVEITGFVNPKKIVKINLDHQGKIDTLEFDDGSRFPEEAEFTSIGGTNITNTILFSNSALAKKTFSHIWMLLSGLKGRGWKIEKHLSESTLAESFANQLREFKETGQLPKSRFNYTPLTQEPGEVEDDLGNQEATGPETPPQMPAGTTKIDVTDLTDWYRLGMDISDMDDADPADYNQGPPQTVIVFPSDEAEQGYLKQFKRLGLKTHDLDPDVPGGEDVTGKHLHEDEQLDEVKMSPSSLQKFAKSPEAEGIQAGFEAELIFTGLGEPEDGEYEPDYEADERVYSIEDIIAFFSDDSYGYGLNDRQADRLREQLEETYYEWYDNQVYSEWQDEQDELIRDAWLEERPWTERLHDALVEGVGVTDEEADKIIEFGEARKNGTLGKKGSEYTEEELNMLSDYNSASSTANDILDEDVQTSIDKQDKIYDRVYEEYRDNYEADDSEFFSDVGIRWMSNVAEEYNLDWPVMSSTGGEGGFSEQNAEQLADSLSEALGVKVVASGGYHSTKRQPGVWIIEPDSSLEADDSDNMPAEIVSPPMPLDECLRQMENFFAWAESNGAYANSSTGFHMGVSLPFRGGDVDYTKLALFLGDEYVLKEFGRSANSFTASAMKKIKQAIESGRAKPADAMELMKHNLLELAHRAIAKNEGFGKYTSINPKGNYIEFRSAGGTNYFEDLDKLKNTLLRYAQAMAIAGDPAAERKEYYKKLYKLISPKEGDPAIDLFARYAAGELSSEQLKAQWAEKALEKEKAQARASASNKWRVFRKDTGETLEIVDAPNRGEARDQAYDKYTGVIPFEVEPYDEGTKEWEAYDPDTGKVLGTTKNFSITNATNYFRDELKLNRFQVREKESEAISPRARLAKRIKDAPAKRADAERADIERQLGVNTERQDFEFVYEPTGRVLDRVTDLDPMQANAVLTDVRRRYSDLQPADIFMRRANVQQPAAQSTNPNQTIQDPEQVRMPNGVPVWEIYDKETGSVLNRLADHTMREAHTRMLAWLQNINAEDPATYSERFGIRPKMLEPGERNIG